MGINRARQTPAGWVRARGEHRTNKAAPRAPSSDRAGTRGSLPAQSLSHPAVPVVTVLVLGAQIPACPSSVHPDPDGSISPLCSSSPAQIQAAESRAPHCPSHTQHCPAPQNPSGTQTWLPVLLSLWVWVFLLGFHERDVPPQGKIKQDRKSPPCHPVALPGVTANIQHFTGYSSSFFSYLIKLLLILFCCWKDQVPKVRNHWNAMYHWNAGFDPATV